MPVNGLVLMTPTSVTATGTGSSATINSNGSVTFSTCTAIRLNGVFTSTYENYMISVRHLQSLGTNPYLKLKLYASGVVASGNSYYWQRSYLYGTTMTGLRSTADSSGQLGGSHNTAQTGTTAYIFGPALADTTSWRGTSSMGDTTISIIDTGGYHANGLAYDGIELSPNGDMTGLVTVHAFNQ